MRALAQLSAQWTQKSNKNEEKLKLKQNSIDKVIMRGDSGWDDDDANDILATKRKKNKTSTKSFTFFTLLIRSVGCVDGWLTS